MDTTEQNSEAPEAAPPTAVDRYWAAFRARTGLDTLPTDFRFDPSFYRALYKDLSEASDEEALAHYLSHGRAELRYGSPYHRLTREGGPPRGALIDLITDPDLRRLVRKGGDDGVHLAYEVLRVGEPFDRELSGFSERHYHSLYTDVANAGVSAIDHYLRHGRAEKRQIYADLLSRLTKGVHPHDPDKPTCFVAVHELSRSGAPVVGCDLMEMASATHNVYGLTLRGGPLLERAQRHCCAVVESEQLAADLPLLLPDVLADAELAVVNSVEAWTVIPAMVEAGVPVATYVHEFTNYSFPTYKPVVTAAFSDLIVFSSELVRSNWDGLMDDLQVDVARDTLILPQRRPRRISLDPSVRDAARDTMSEILGMPLDGRKIVVGAGQVSPRKGTDAFIMAAQLAAHDDEDLLFVWIGSDWNHEDLTYGVWIDARLQAMPDQDSFRMLPAGPYYFDLLKVADVFFLTSILDPLPNVVFDALDHGCDVVYFEGVTGFDDADYRALSAMRPVPVGDLRAAVSAISDALASDEGASEAAPASEAASAKPELFKIIHAGLLEAIGKRTPVADTTPAFQSSVIFQHKGKDDPARAGERRKLATLGRSLMWDSPDEVRQRVGESEHFSHAMMRVQPLEPARVTPPPFHLHLHAHYTTDFARTVSHYRAFRDAQSVVVTTNTAAKRNVLEKAAQRLGLDADIRVVRNIGRDILPFMEVVAERPDGEVWGHFHLKESRGTMSSAERWRDFLFDTLMGDAEGYTNALTKMQDPAVGLVAPLDPNVVEWRANRRILGEMQARFPFRLPSRLIAFPVGNMFYARSEVVSALMDVFGRKYPWPREPIANDGTVFHFIERIWPSVTAWCGLDSVFVSAPDISRD